MRHGGWLLAALSALSALSACGERPQTTDSKRKTDARAFEGAPPAYTVGGWKAGDAASWEQQLKARAQNQNEYTRIAP